MTTTTPDHHIRDIRRRIRNILRAVPASQWDLEETLRILLSRHGQAFDVKGHHARGQRNSCRAPYCAPSVSTRTHWFCCTRRLIYLTFHQISSRLQCSQKIRSTHRRS
jgi:hypothetical protein